VSNEAILGASFQTFDRVWIHFSRGGGSEERYDKLPDGRKCKSVYVIELPNGEVVEQCIVRPQEVRPPGRGWRFHATRPRFTVWRRPCNERV
jgi:hypothetical protein